MEATTEQEPVKKKRKPRRKCRVIAVSNQKGGVGKTATAHALIAGLKARGYRVLAIDMDPQRNLSFVMHADELSDDGIMRVLMRKIPIQAAIEHTQQGHLIAATEDLATADLTLNETGKEYRLKELLEPIKKDYDFIVIDTPPAVATLTVNALTAADSVIIPALPDILSLRGLFSIAVAIRSVRQYCNPKLETTGVLMTRFDPRGVLARGALSAFTGNASAYGTKLFETKIRANVAVQEAQAMRQSIFDFAPQSNAAQDYNDFIDEILREWGYE